MTRDQCRALDRAYSALEEAQRRAVRLDRLIEAAEATGSVELIDPNGRGGDSYKIPFSALVAARKELIETAEKAVRDCGGEP